MKKAIVLSTSKHFTKTVAEFIRQLKGAEPAFLVGGFAHSLNYAELVQNTSGAYVSVIVDLVEQDREAVDSNINVFEHFCQRENIKYRIHEDQYAFDLDHLIMESRFADLLVVNASMFSRGTTSQKPEIELRAALKKAECPVLLLPENFRSFKKIAIAYDGNKESMYALKQFSYLFPQFGELPTEIIYLSEKEKDDVPSIRMLKEYVSTNLHCIQISKVHINPARDLSRWAAQQKDVLVIAGSYGRSGLSDLLNDSFIDPVLDMKQLPVFITHR